MFFHRAYKPDVTLGRGINLGDYPSTKDTPQEKEKKLVVLQRRPEASDEFRVGI